nr:uncharacterized protein LOC105338900 isoform X1 [Crassostrea gigas]
MSNLDRTMEKKQRGTVKKSAAGHGKVVDKGKVGKAKTIAVKPKIKALSGKRPTTKAPKKTKPAPHVEPGYSLYSSLSEDSTQETCVRLLNQLTEKRKTEAVDHHTQFNTRLSSSTPDPDRLFVDIDQQMIPERDTSSPLWKTVLASQNVAANKDLCPTSCSGFISHQWSSESTSHPFKFPSAHAVPLKAPAAISNDMSQMPFTPCNPQVPATQTSSQGFVPIGLGNDSDAESLQQFPIKEHAPSLQKFVSHNAEALSDNQTTPDTSRSGYVNLPRPAGGVGIPPQQSGIPQYTQQNGLFQLRSQVPQQPQDGPYASKVQAFDSFDAPKVPQGFFEQYASGQMSYPSPVPENQQEYQYEGSYLLPQTVVPEKDTPPFTIPQLNLSDDHQMERGPNLHDTLSTITGSVNQSMDTPRTLFSSGSPKSSRQVTPKNSSGSSSSKSVHFHIQDNPVKDLSKSSSKTSHETQTDDGCLYQQADTGHQINELMSTGVPANSHSSVHSSVQTEGQKSEKSAQSHDDSSQLVTSSVKSDVPNPWSGVQAKAGMKKLRYCLRELKECGKINKDKEIKRLVKDVEDTLETIPQLKSTFSLQAEIDLAIQPLRSENAQLRRRLRLMNKQAKGTTTQPTEAKKDLSKPDDSVSQKKITALQRELIAEKEFKVKLATEMKDMHTQLQKMKVERSRLIASVSEKETEELKIRQECIQDAHQFRNDLDSLQRQIKGARIQYEALERENHILQVTLHQRDDEIKQQKDVVESLREAVGQVLKELEASRTGGDTSFISNNSFSLQRLLHILGGKQITGSLHYQKMERSVLSDPGVHSLSNVYKPQTRASALTAESLATHNRLQPPTKSGSRKFGEDRDPVDNLDEGAPVDYRSSMSDTEVEYQTFDSHKNTRQNLPSQRHRSLSGDGKHFENNGQQLITHTTHYGRDGSYLTGMLKKHDRSDNVFMAKNQRLRFEEEDTFPKSGYENSSRRYGHHEETRSDLDTQSKFSAAESRYSVTDYFKKYNSHNPTFKTHSRTMDPSRTQESFEVSDVSKPNVIPRSKPHRRSLSQPETSVLSNSELPHFSSPQKPSSHQSSLTQHSITQKSLLSPQDRLYRGTALDNSISAIDDDNISSVSGRSPSSSSVDEKTFKKGIATLDANILKLQLALQKTKSMLS